MNKFYFDFNVNHFLRKFYCVVIAEDLELAKAAITHELGFMPYDWYTEEDQFNPKFYKQGCYCSIKQRTDVHS